MQFMFAGAISDMFMGLRRKLKKSRGNPKSHKENVYQMRIRIRLHPDSRLSNHTVPSINKFLPCLGQETDST